MQIAFLLTIIDIASAAILQHTLTRRKPRKIEMIKRSEYAKYVKYRNASHFPSTFTQKVFELGFYEYVNITIGTPDQEFTVLFDTGSANLWITGSDCVFESNSSSTLVMSNTTWTIEYAFGTAEGVFGTDIMKFGGKNERQLIVPNTTFGIANNLSLALIEEAYDGILGLAFTDLAEGNVVPPLINAIDQNSLEQSLFTVWLEQRKILGEPSDGLITYGAIDVTNCGSVIAFQNLTTAVYYEFTMSAIGVGDYTYKKECEAISDTGSPAISGSKLITDWIAKVAGAVYDATDNVYMLKCNSTIPVLHITIGGKKYLVEPLNYLYFLEGNLCMLAITPFHDFGGFSPQWILGTPFNRQYCHIYDVGGKRIGFAPSLVNFSTFVKKRRLTDTRISYFDFYVTL